jgi:hypothetical protein
VLKVRLASLRRETFRVISLNPDGDRLAGRAFTLGVLAAILPCRLPEDYPLLLPEEE